MGFPVPGSAIEQSLDLNQHLIRNPAATFLMRVEGDMVPADQEVQPGDLLVVDRSQTTQDGSLVVAAIAGTLQVLRIQKHHGKLMPPEWQPETDGDMEIWGVVAHLIRKV